MLKENKKILYNFILFIIISLFIIQNSSAIAFDVGSNGTGRIGLGNGFFTDEPGQFNFSGSRNVYVLTEPDTIWLVEPLSKAVGLSNGFGIVARGDNDLRYSLVASDGFLYFVDGSGIKKRLGRNLASSVTANDTVSESNPSGLIVNLYGTTSVYTIRQYGDYLYFIESGILKRIPLDTYVSETVFTGITAYSGYDFDIFEQSNVLTVITTLYDTAIGKHKVYTHNSTVKNNLIWTESGVFLGGATTYESPSIILTDNYIYLSMDWTNGGIGTACSSAGDVQIVLYRNNYSVKTADDAGYRSGCWYNYSSASLGAYSTYALYSETTTQQYNTFNFLEVGTDIGAYNPAELAYNIKQVNSLYDNYYNNSLFEIQYNVQISTSDIDEVNNYYNWRIELVSPDSVKIADYPILASSLDCLDSLCIVPPNNYGFSGTLKFQPPTSGWDNGTYTVSLYEENNTASNKALLDDDDFNVYNQSGSLSGGVQPDLTSQSSSQRMNTMIGSNYFWAFIMVLIGLVVGVSFGVIGAVLGGGAGVVFSFLMNLMPLWALLLFAIIIFLCLAVVIKSRTGV